MERARPWQGQGGTSIPGEQAAGWFPEDQAARHGRETLQGDVLAALTKLFLARKRLLAMADGRRRGMGTPCFYGIIKDHEGHWRAKQNMVF